MKLLGFRPSVDGTESAPDAEVLIREAKRRERRRRLIWFALIVVVVGGGITTGVALSGPSTSPGSSAASSQASGARAGAASTGKVTPDQPVSLAVSREGDLYIGDSGRNEILERMPSGRYRVVAGTGVAGLTGDGGPAIRAEVNFPDGLVIAPDGTLYFTQAGRHRAPVSSGYAFNTVIREITPAGTISTIAGLHPSCASGAVQSIPTESTLFYVSNAPPLLSPSGALVVEANLCVDREQVPGANVALTVSGRLIRVTYPVPAIASIDCGSRVPGPGFHVYSCSSGGGGGPDGHRPELLVVRSNGSHVAYPDNDNQSGNFAVGDGEVVATYDGNIVRVTSNDLVQLLTNKQLLSDLHLRAEFIFGITDTAVGPAGDVYFVASILPGVRPRGGCQSYILERTTAGVVRQIWVSSPGQICF